MPGKPLHDLPVDLLVQDLFWETIELVRGQPQVGPQLPAPLRPESLAGVVHLVFREGNGGYIYATRLHLGCECGEECLAETGISILDEVEAAVRLRDHSPEHQGVGVLLDVLPYEAALVR